MLSNAYFLAKFRFDTIENEPAKILQIFQKQMLDRGGAALSFKFCKKNAKKASQVTTVSSSPADHRHPGVGEGAVELADVADVVRDLRSEAIWITEANELLVFTCIHV